MTKLLTYALGIALLGAVLTNCTTHNRLQAERLAHQTSKAQYAEQVAAAQAQRADEEAKRRKAEQELTHAQEAHGEEVAALRVDLDRARAAGRVVDGRVRSAAADVAQRASQVCADSTSAELRQAASDAIVVLAELRDRADERAGELARFSTDAHLAGLACERRYQEAYDQLKGN